jgi:hypothetical protein
MRKAPVTKSGAVKFSNIGHTSANFQQCSHPQDQDLSIEPVNIGKLRSSLSHIVSVHKTCCLMRRDR